MLRAMSKPAREETRMHCGKCTAKIAGQDAHEHKGPALCENCCIAVAFSYNYGKYRYLPHGKIERNY